MCEGILSNIKQMGSVQVKMIKRKVWFDMEIEVVLPLSFVFLFSK